MLNNSPGRSGFCIYQRWVVLRVSLSIGLVFLPLLSFCSETFTFTTLAGNAGYGSADGKGRDARFNFPQGVAVDSTNMIYVADTENCTIRKITPDGTATTLAGLAGSRGS